MKRTKIEIIPMVDTMFFLLVFFMLSSLSLTRLNGLPVDLPEAGTATQVRNLELAVTVDKSGRVFLDQSEVSIEGLSQAITGKGTPTQPLTAATLIINADEGASHGLVVRCIDEARKAGVSKFAIATQPTGESS